MRPLGRVAGYDVLVAGAPLLFADPRQSPTIEHFLLGFSGAGALCACIGPDGGVLFGCDLYGLTEYFYRIQGNRLLVSPRLSRLAQGDAQLDEVSLFELFRTGTIYGSGTPISGIGKSCPLSVLELRFSGEALRCTRRDLFPRGDAPGGFPEAIRGAAATIARSARQVQVNFSGGADSTAMLLAMRESRAAVTVAHYLLIDRELPTAYARLAGSGLRLNVLRPWRQIKCVDLGNRPCAIHTDPEVDLELADLARHQGSDLVLTGQNADAMAEFGNTRRVSVRDLAAGVLLQGLSGSDARVPLARAIQKFRERMPRRLLRIYAKGAALDQYSPDFDRAFLMALACRRRATPIWYGPDRLAFLSWELRQAWLDRMEKEVQLVQEADGLTFRQKLFVIQFRNYLIGGDVRCITAAAARAGVRNAQLYTTPPLVRHFFNAMPSMGEVFRPKGAIRRYGHWSEGPAIESERILSDSRRVRVQAAAYRLVGRKDDRPAGEKLAELGARFPWISRAALAALATDAGPSWRSRVSHIHALVHGDYEPMWFEDDGAMVP
ncbi:MAG TPA: hypothetical protein VFS44_15755 [Gemmatimonadaceae bacterium]|nr:hypothetical protein [Gemmatimonadaceae bacterium]